MNNNKPMMFIQLGYKDVFSDYEIINILKHVENIPSVKAIEYIVSRTNKVLYAFSDYRTQQELLKEAKKYFRHKDKYLIGNFLLRNSNNDRRAMLFECQSTFLFIMLMLQSNNQVDRELSDNDINKIYTAYLYCAQIWTDKQASRINDNKDITLMSLKMDLPIVEFKLYKDFRVQLYKANQFFKFCDKDDMFSNFLQYFYQENGINNYNEYLLAIFNLFERSLRDDNIDDSDFPQHAKKIVDKYTIDLNDYSDIWNTKDLTKLRNHFFIKTGVDKYLLTNANFLIDKFYQGLIFDFWLCVQKNGGVNSKGKIIKNFGEFRSIFGEKFSESEILYDVLNKTFLDHRFLKFSGEELRQYGDGEPDFYIRDNNNVFLFEYKDLILADAVKQSDDCAQIKDEILKRICKDDDVNRKGGAQLLHTINKIYTEDYLDNFDSNRPNELNIYPILITTDRAFDALGVSFIYFEEFSKIAQRKYNDLKNKIMPPVLINIDTIFLLMTRIRNNEICFEKLLNEYIENYKHPLSIVIPFSTYTYDHCRKGSYTEDELNIMFDGLIP